jgi:hypothetical protein
MTLTDVRKPVVRIPSQKLALAITPCFQPE